MPRAQTAIEGDFARIIKFTALKEPMGALDLLIHALNFIAPAAAVALVLALASRFMQSKRPPALAMIAHAAINFVVGGTVLALGLWWQGADGRMVTYAALVTVMATLQWLLGRHWR
jgi:hypothetical protein